MQRLKGILMVSMLLALLALPVSAVSVRTAHAQPNGAYFYLDISHYTGTFNEEIEIELSTSTSHSITNQNMDSYSEIEWYRGATSGDKQFFWGPDALVVDGQDDVEYGPNPTGTGSLNVIVTGTQAFVAGTLSGYFAPNGDYATISVKFTFDQTTGAWNGGVVLTMHGVLFNGIGSDHDSDAGTWLPGGYATWTKIITPGALSGWSMDFIGAGWGSGD